jgi:hypothetical protein
MIERQKKGGCREKDANQKDAVIKNGCNSSQDACVGWS